MTDSELEMDMEELSSAEDFFDYFEIDFDMSIVHVNRLHILQRFHDYLESIDGLTGTGDSSYALYRSLLLKAYSDFEQSDARNEKVFKVFKMQEPREIMVPLTDLMPEASSASKL